MRQSLQVLKMETQNQLLVSNSAFQQSQKKLEEKYAAVKEEEEEKNLKEEEKKNVVRETSQVVQAIKNIFARCQATMRIKPQLIATRENNLADLLTFNLDVIHSRLIDLKEICDEYKASAGAEHGGHGRGEGSSGYGGVGGATMQSSQMQDTKEVSVGGTSMATGNPNNSGNNLAAGGGKSSRTPLSALGQNSLLI